MMLWTCQQIVTHILTALGQEVTHILICPLSGVTLTSTQPDKAHTHADILTTVTDR